MAKMKRSEKILWLMVAVALAANIWLPRHLKQRYSWERDLSQRCAVDFCKTRDEVKKEMIAIASMMAQKVVAASIDTKIQDTLVDDTLKEMGDSTWLS